MGAESIAKFDVTATKLAFNMSSTENISLPKSTLCIQFSISYFRQNFSTADIISISESSELSSKEVFLSSKTWSDMLLATTLSYLANLTNTEASFPEKFSGQIN